MVFQNKSIKGFTIVEALVSMLIFSVVTAAVYSALVAGNRSFNYYENSVMAKGEIRRAMETMTRELREAKNLLVITDEGSVRINFYRPSQGTVSYIWSTGGDDAFKIMRFANGQLKPIANKIGYFSIENLSSSVVIEMYATKTGIKPGEGDIGLTKQIALRQKTKAFL